MAVQRAAAPLCCRRRGEVKERELFYGSRAVAKLLPVKLRPRDCCPGGNQDGSPSETSCLCATRVGGGDIGFDGPFMRPEFFFATIVDSLELFTVSYAIKGVALTLRW